MNSSNKNLPNKERRALTVQAVIDLAGDRNPSEITTAAIAKRMGISQSALFRHFPSKSAIQQAVMEWVAERLLARTENAILDEPSPLAALERIFMSHVDFVTDFPGIPRMVFGELQRAEETTPKRMIRTLIRHYHRDRLVRLIEKGKACGELDPATAAEPSATLFIGTIQGLVMQSLLDGDVRRIRREAPAVFAIYQRGIMKIPNKEN